MNLGHIVSDWGIYFDPDPTETIIEADRDLLELNERMKLLEDDDNKVDEQDMPLSKWVLRFAISDDI